MRMSNFVLRTLFAIWALPTFVWLLWMGGAWREGLLTFVVGAAVWEYQRLLRLRHPPIGRVPESVLPTLAAASAWLSPWGPLSCFGSFRALLVGGVVVALLLWGMRRLPREDVFPWVALSGAGFAYLAGWGASFFALSAGPRGWSALAPLVLAMGVCWSGDTFAYVFGRLFGRHKLCPELSPAKTIEGALGGVIAPALFAAWWGSSHLGLSVPVATLVGAVLGGAGIVGDLAESVLKRWAGAKDSSSLFPGHGGMLDRMDSAFLVAPLLHFALMALS